MPYISKLISCRTEGFLPFVEPILNCLRKLVVNVTACSMWNKRQWCTCWISCITQTLG